MKIWVDDVRPAPDGFVWIKSVNQFKDFLENSNCYIKELEKKYDDIVLRLIDFHPTQKPVNLLEYLIRTYTLENETVLDFTMGSGSTRVACVNMNRNFIGIELNDDYFNIAKERIAEAKVNKE